MESTVIDSVYVCVCVCVYVCVCSTVLFPLVLCSDKKVLRRQIGCGRYGRSGGSEACLVKCDSKNCQQDENTVAKRLT